MSEKNTAELAFDAAKDYVKAKGLTSGLPGGAHAGMIVHALCELGLIDGEDAKAKKTAFEVVYALENGSAVRQKLEKAGVLAAQKKGTADENAWLA